MNDHIANAKEYIQEILEYMRNAQRHGLDRAHLADFLKRRKQLPMEGSLIHLVDQLQYNEGIEVNADRGFRDLRPDLDQASKRVLILMALEKYGSKKAQEIRFFESYTRFVRVGEERLEVEELFRTKAWGFIVFRILDGSGFVLDEIRNNSAAYWSEERRIDLAEARRLYRDPGKGQEIEWYKYAVMTAAEFGA